MIRLALLLAALAAPAAAQTRCAPFHDIATMLPQQFGEVPIATGAAQQNAMFLFLNRQTGTWSIVIYRPDGVACIPAHGDQYDAPTPPPEGDPA